MLLPTLGSDRARDIVGGFAGAHVLVIGDSMLDKFIVGRVTRISPEAPVPVVAFDHESYRLGGAANVAHNIVALGGRATLISVTGQDDAATTLTGACHDSGIAPAFVADRSRRTTTKMRVVTERNHQVVRVDYEAESEIAGDVEARILTALDQSWRDVKAVVVSDYLKGCVSQRVMESVLALGREHRIPILVDPKIPHLGYYAGATVITPNTHEAETATLMRIRTLEDARAAAHLFRDRAACQSVLMTRGDQGMWLLGSGVEGYLPAVAREIADVTGAGDTVIATLAMSLSATASLAEAARLANEAAAISVGKFGAAVVTPSELLASL